MRPNRSRYGRGHTAGYPNRRRAVALALIAVGWATGPSANAALSAEDLAKLAQNPIANLISLVLAIIAHASRTFNTLGWIAIIAYFVLTVVYGYYYFTLPTEAAEMRKMEQHSETAH